MPRPIDVYEHANKTYFRVAKDSVFGNRAYLDPDEPAYSGLQDFLNQHIRNTPGLLQWSASFLQGHPLYSASFSYQKRFQQYICLTDIGLRELQKKLVEHYLYMRDPKYPKQPLADPAPAPTARRFARSRLPLQTRTRP